MHSTDTEAEAPCDPERNWHHSRAHAPAGIRHASPVPGRACTAWMNGVLRFLLPPRSERTCSTREQGPRRQPRHGDDAGWIASRSFISVPATTARICMRPQLQPC